MNNAGERGAREKSRYFYFTLELMTINIEIILAKKFKGGRMKRKIKKIRKVFYRGRELELSASDKKLLKREVEFELDFPPNCRRVSLQFYKSGDVDVHIL
jgi:hypothetical protein